MDRAPFAGGVTNFEVAVRKETDSGPGNDDEVAQRRNPTPGFRKYHGTLPTDLVAYKWLGLGLTYRAVAIAGELGAAELATIPELEGFEMGKVIGWGTGQGAGSAAETELLTESLTRETVRNFARGGVTRKWIEEQLVNYEKALLNPRKAGNTNLIPRKKLIEKILELWPKKKQFID